MDFYAQVEKKVNDLKAEIISYINIVLTGEKGWKIGDRVKVYDEVTHHEYAFEILRDRILYGEYYSGDTFYQYARNIEWMSVDELKNLLHDAYHAQFNYKNLK